MKKSDMICRIAEWMEQNNDDPLLTPLCAAEAFLELVEDLGMTPPEVHKPLSKLEHHRGPFGLLLPDCDFHNGGYDVREWEDE